MGSYIVCRCPKGCKKGMTLWQVRAGIAKTTEGKLPGIWLYVYCDYCSSKYMADFLTPTAIVGWLELITELPITKLRPKGG